MQTRNRLPKVTKTGPRVAAGALPLATVPRVQSRPRSLNTSRKMLLAVVIGEGHDVIGVGQVDDDETIGLVAGLGADVDHRHGAGQRSERIGRGPAPVSGFMHLRYAVGTSMPSGPSTHCMQGGWVAWELREGENGGKRRQAEEACSCVCSDD